MLEPIFALASRELLTIYALGHDPRQRAHTNITELRSVWAAINSLVEGIADPGVHAVQRDGLCHEAVMWFVHHLSEHHRAELAQQITLPLLPPQRHALAHTTAAHAQVAKDYESKERYQQCHVYICAVHTLFQR